MSQEDIEVFRGEERLLNYTVTDDDGNTIDLTDKDVYFIVRKEFEDSSNNEFTVSATNKQADGTCDILLTENQTDIEPRLYEYEVYVEYQGGEDYVAEINDFFVKKRVQR